MSWWSPRWNLTLKGNHRKRAPTYPHIFPLSHSVWGTVWFLLPTQTSTSTDRPHPAARHLYTDPFLSAQGGWFLAAPFQGLQHSRQGLSSYTPWSWAGFRSVHHSYCISNPAVIKPHSFLIGQIHELSWASVSGTWPGLITPLQCSEVTRIARTFPNPVASIPKFDKNESSVSS